MASATRMKRSGQALSTVPVRLQPSATHTRAAAEFQPQSASSSRLGNAARSLGPERRLGGVKPLPALPIYRELLQATQQRPGVGLRDYLIFRANETTAETMRASMRYLKVDSNPNDERSKPPTRAPIPYPAC